MNSLTHWEEKLKSSFEPIYLFIGEKPLLMPLINNIINTLLPEQESKELNLETFQGDFPIEDVLRSMSLKSFGGMKKVIFLKEPFFITETEKKEQEGEKNDNKSLDLFLDKLKKLNKTKHITLIIQSDKIDSRKKIAKSILEISLTVDLRVDKEDPKNKRNFLLSFCNEILTKNKKKIKNDVLNYLIDLVGEDDLTGLQNELEKVINFTQENEIKKQDIIKVVSATREEQIYELTQSISEKNLKKSLIILKNLLTHQNQPIVIAGVLFNYIKRILSIKQIMKTLKLNTQRYDIFKKNEFPEIKSILDKNSVDIFANPHPYALFMLIKNSFNFSEKKLLFLYNDFCDIDLSLKGSSIPHDIILERFIIKIITEDEENINESK